MKHNMIVSRTNMDVALLDPAFGVQKQATEALYRLFQRLGTKDAVQCFSCGREFTWSGELANPNDLMPAAYVRIERDKLKPASALLCWECNNDEGMARALKAVFKADDIKKYNPTHLQGGTA